MVYYIVEFVNGKKECFESFMKAMDVFRLTPGAVKLIGVEGDLVLTKKEAA